MSTKNKKNVQQDTGTMPTPATPAPIDANAKSAAQAELVKKWRTILTSPPAEQKHAAKFLRILLNMQLNCSSQLGFPFDDVNNFDKDLNSIVVDFNHKTKQIAIKIIHENNVVNGIDDKAKAAENVQAHRYCREMWEQDPNAGPPLCEPSQLQPTNRKQKASRRIRVETPAKCAATTIQSMTLSPKLGMTDVLTLYTFLEQYDAIINLCKNGLLDYLFGLSSHINLKEIGVTIDNIEDQLKQVNSLIQCNLNLHLADNRRKILIIRNLVFVISPESSKYASPMRTLASPTPSMFSTYSATDSLSAYSFMSDETMASASERSPSAISSSSPLPSSASASSATTTILTKPTIKIKQLQIQFMSSVYTIYLSTLMKEMYMMRISRNHKEHYEIPEFNETTLFLIDEGFQKYFDEAKATLYKELFLVYDIIRENLNKNIDHPLRANDFIGHIRRRGERECAFGKLRLFMAIFYVGDNDHIWPWIDQLELMYHLLVPSD